MKNKTSKFIYIFLILIFLFFILIKIYLFLNTAKIQINELPTQTFQNNLVISGQVIGIKDFFILGKSVLLNQNLNFEKEVFLFPGINIITLIGITKKGKKIVEKREVFYTKK